MAEEKAISERVRGRLWDEFTSLSSIHRQLLWEDGITKRTKHKLQNVEQFKSGLIALLVSIKSSLGDYPDLRDDSMYFSRNMEKMRLEDAYRLYEKLEEVMHMMGITKITKRLAD